MSYGANDPNGLPLGLPSILSLGLPPLVNPYPALNLDFINNQTLDSRVTFSRGSQATLFDSTGTLKYAKHNLILQSQDFDTTWTKIGTLTVSTDSTSAPNGTVTADKFILGNTVTSGNAALSQNVTKPLSPARYTVSAYVKAGEFNSIRLILRDSASAANFVQAYFNAETGVIAQAANAGGTYTNASAEIISVGDGWYRISVSGDTSTEATLNIRLLVYQNGTGTATGDGTSGLFLWGAQLNLANMEGGVTSSLTTYYPTTTAAYYAPRFDYNPSTLQPLGLLIEEARTNSIRNNTMVGAVAGTPGTLPTNWSFFESASELSAAVVGTGTESGITYIDIKVSGTVTAQRSALISFETVTGVAASASQSWTESLYLKLQAGSTANIEQINVRTDQYSITPTFISSITSSALTITSADLKTQRQLLSVTTPASTAYIQPILRVRSNASGAIDITLRIGLPQLELGAFATSVIPTTTTALTRNADLASMTGTNFSSWYNAAEGTLFAESVKNGNVNFQQLININDGTTNNSIAFGFGSGLNPLREDVVVSGSSVASITGIANTSTIGTILKVAGAYKVDDFAISGNGGAVATDTLGAVPVVNRMDIGYRSAGTPLTFTGTISRIAYYPVRLASSQLQALTA